MKKQAFRVSGWGGLFLVTLACAPGCASLRGQQVHIESGKHWIGPLGTVPAGTQLTIRINSSSDVRCALFDDAARLICTDIVKARGTLRHTVREATGLQIGFAAPQDDSQAIDLRYDIREQPALVPPQRARLVVADFHGGDVLFNGQRVVVKPFDAGAIGSEYAGRTQEMKRVILSTLERNFSPYRLEFRSSDQGLPAQKHYLSLHFGGEEPNLLGRAEALGFDQILPSGKALIYVRNFITYAGPDVDAARMGVIVGMVASHELGHLLGLSDTKADRRDIMALSGASPVAEFRSAALHDCVFPYGRQDASWMLTSILGLKAGVHPHTFAAVEPDETRALRN